MKMKMKIMALLVGVALAQPSQGAVWANISPAQVQSMEIARAFLYNGTGTVFLPSISANYFCGGLSGSSGSNIYSSCNADGAQYFPKDYIGSVLIKGTPYMFVQLPNGWTVNGGGVVKSGNNSWYIPYGGNYAGNVQANCTGNSSTNCVSVETSQPIMLPGSGSITVKTTEPDGEYTFTGKVSMFIDPMGITAPMYNGVNINFRYKVKNKIPYNPDGPEPPSPVICTNSNNIQVNHGTMLLSEVNGHQKIEHLNIFCSGGEATATLTLQGALTEGLSLVEMGKNVVSKNGVSTQQNSGFAKKINTTFRSGLNTVYVRSILAEKSGGANAGVITGIDLLKPIEFH